MKEKSIRYIFWFTVAVFLAVILLMTGLVSFAGDGYIAGFPSWIVLMGLGIALIVLTLKKKTGGKIKIFLLLTGASAAGFLVFVLLHNLVSALFNFEEAVFFIIAVILCPAGLLAGITGTIIIYVRDSLAGHNMQHISGGESN